VWPKTPQAHADIAAISSLFLDNPHTRLSSSQSMTGSSLRRSSSSSTAPACHQKCTLMTARAVVPTSPILFPFFFRFVILE
jgi:hypothetical protein